MGVNHDMQTCEMQYFLYLQNFSWYKMNYLKKLGGRGQSDKGQDNSLGLTHLRKLFAEFRHPTRRATQEEQEYKLYNMIPLFCKVWSLAILTELSLFFKGKVCLLLICCYLNLCVIDKNLHVKSVWAKI